MLALCVKAANAKCITGGGAEEDMNRAAVLVARCEPDERTLDPVLQLCPRFFLHAVVTLQFVT
jgi:hypothetical protein